MLEIKNLTKIYDDGTEALRNVSFDVQDGEFLIVIGLSGSGKSTLLRCINRLIDPTEGQIYWNGREITAMEPDELRMVRRKFAMIFQQFNLVNRLKVITNVLTGRLGYNSPWSSVLHRFSAKDKEMAFAALERVGLVEQAFKLARELSGGQQQRVGIARAITQQPEVFLADEPVASLDPVLAHNILGYLEQLNREDHMTVICSLHYLDLVQRYATRVVGLRDGEIVWNGNGDDIQQMTDAEFKEIYGEEAARVSAATRSDQSASRKSVNG